MTAAAPSGGVVVRVAPAKVNLTLAVVGRRPDGFHDLHSIMVPLGIGDRLSLAPAAGPADTLHVVSPGGGTVPDLGPAEKNLVLRGIAAARRALRANGVDSATPPLAVRLEKRIPVAAGLAGGSTDGAAAISGALEAWGCAGALPFEALLATAASIGSDVPFFFAGGWALVEGRGERVAPLRAPTGGAPGILLVTPAVGVSTPETFGAFAAGARPDGGASRATSAHLAGELAAGLTVARLMERAGLLAVANDLMPATASLVPALVTLRRGLGRLLRRPVGQSGSGPTLWMLFPSEAAAAEAASVVSAAFGSGDLAAPGEGAPRVLATSILGSTTGDLA